MANFKSNKYFFWHRQPKATNPNQPTLKIKLINIYRDYFVGEFSVLLALGWL
jgi:hypothetical protein